MTQTKYYDPQDSGMKSLLAWKATVFELVLERKEFYLYIIWNLILTTVCIVALPEGTIDDFNWDVASIMQYVMTFFATFYNDMCYSRYTRLYPDCVSFGDGVIDMVQELCLNMPSQDLYPHRIACTKYLLAVVYEHFMLICGGRLNDESWKELVKKGLLTEEEATLLACFPGGRSTTVLCCWVLFIIRNALVQDCMWRRNDKSHDVSQQTVHIYNRLCRHIVNMETSARHIGYTLANPIPFAYYQLMSFILLFNVMLLATFSALYRSYLSVFPFSVALIIYMGLRKVSTALADPFGTDSVDFAVPDFIRNCFERAVCVLVAFVRPELRKWILIQVDGVEDFDEHHLRRPFKQSLFKETESEKRGPAAVHLEWTSDSVFEDADEGHDVLRSVKYSLDPRGVPPEKKKDEVLISDEEKLQQAKHEIEQELEKHDELEMEEADLEFESNRLQFYLEELAAKFPHISFTAEEPKDPDDHSERQITGESDPAAAALQHRSMKRLSFADGSPQTTQNKSHAASALPAAAIPGRENSVSTGSAGTGSDRH